MFRYNSHLCQKSLINSKTTWCFFAPTAVYIYMSIIHSQQQQQEQMRESLQAAFLGTLLSAYRFPSLSWHFRAKPQAFERSLARILPFYYPTSLRLSYIKKMGRATAVTFLRVSFHRVRHYRKWETPLLVTLRFNSPTLRGLFVWFLANAFVIKREKKITKQNLFVNL